MPAAEWHSRDPTTAAFMTVGPHGTDMELELRFFANFRDAVGQKTITREFEGETVTVGELVDVIEAEFPDVEILDEHGELRTFVRTMKNGRAVAHLEGLETILEDGDTVSIFPPVAGG